MMNRVTNNDLAPALRSSDVEQLATELLERLKYRIGKDPKVAKPHDWLTAAILVARDRITDKWMDSTRRTYATGAKRVYYLSLEFLIGRLMRDAMTNTGIMDAMREALASHGVDIDVIAELEPDAALGNGGLGRLAACFMESMATVDVPAYGYGIRYVHGLFRQQMADGWQVELPETWLAHGNPWEFERRESSYESASAAPSRRSTSARTSSASSGSRPSASSRRPMTRRLSAGGQSASTRCACGPPTRSTRSCSTPSTPAITSAP
jgi:starch phosphorylase